MSADAVHDLSLQSTGAASGQILEVGQSWSREAQLPFEHATSVGRHGVKAGHMAAAETQVTLSGQSTEALGGQAGLGGHIAAARTHIPEDGQRTGAAAGHSEMTVTGHRRTGRLCRWGVSGTGRRSGPAGSPSRRCTRACTCGPRTATAPGGQTMPVGQSAEALTQDWSGQRKGLSRWGTRAATRTRRGC